MKNFFFGNFESKINGKIIEIVTNGNFVKNEFVLGGDNLSEIITAMFSQSLFGDKNLFIINITESEIEDLEKFINLIHESCDVILTYPGELSKTSKILKLIPKEFLSQEFTKNKSGNIFAFTDYILSKDITKTYQELQKLDDNEVLIFNNIVSSLRSLIGLKFNLSLKDKIVPFKLGFYKKMQEKYSENELIDIFNNLYINDLRFKKGEITNEMIVLHSINLFFQKNGNTKQK